MNAPLKSPSFWLATWFGCGLMRPAPGTWGTLGALPFAIPMLAVCGWPALLIAAAIVFAAGYWASGEFEKMTGEHDSGKIVIDEVAGMFLALLAAAPSALSIALAFLLFRFFDVVKPWPVSWCDKKLPGALGVMMDDIAAGLLAAACLGGLHYAGFGG